jgi:hypothetical protein
MIVKSGTVSGERGKERLIEGEYNQSTFICMYENIIMNPNKREEKGGV